MTGDIWRRTCQESEQEYRDVMLPKYDKQLVAVLDLGLATENSESVETIGSRSEGPSNATQGAQPAAEIRQWRTMNCLQVKSGQKGQRPPISKSQVHITHV